MSPGQAGGASVDSGDDASTYSCAHSSDAWTKRASGRRGPDHGRRENWPTDLKVLCELAQARGIGHVEMSSDYSCGRF